MPKSIIGMAADRIIRPSTGAGIYGVQNAALQKSIEQMFGKKTPRTPFGEQFRRDHPNWRPPGGGDEPSVVGGKVMFDPGTFKKALGWGVAAAGGFSILGFFSQSRAKYLHSIRSEGELFSRGISRGYDTG